MELYFIDNNTNNNNNENIIIYTQKNAILAIKKLKLIINRAMKNTFLSLIFGLTILNTFGQANILPGDKSINTSLIKRGKFTMGYYVVKDDIATEICIYETEIDFTNNRLIINTNLGFLKSYLEWKEKIVVDGTSLKTISRSSERDTRSFDIKYSNSITGEHLDKSGKKKNIDIPLKEDCFDIASYPFIICALPLDTGYRATIPVCDMDSENYKKTYKVEITNVKSNIFHSDLTGDHQVWRVDVKEESTGNLYIYDIDKKTRKIYKIGIAANGNNLMLIDKETDYNPFKNKFDKESTYKLVSNGNSVILGEAFARDDRSGKDDKKFDIGIINLNKKQFAKKGTKVLIIPYTAFYKEWFEINKKQSKIKNAKPIPLPKEAAECIKYSTVYDNEGHFEFTNLMPGEYLLFTAFGYEDTFPQSKVTGTADKYINGSYSGTEVYTEIFQMSQNATASIAKVVSIKTNGEKLNVKLKKS